jgi:hypothetical protein
MFSEKGDTREDANKNKNEREEKISDGVSNQDDVKIMIFLGTLTLPFLINKSR